MDIKDLAQEQQNPTAEMVLKHPKTDEPLGEEGDYITFDIYSPFADKMQKKEDKLSRSMLSGTLASQMKNKNEDEAIESAVEAVSNETANEWLSRIAGWHNLEYEGEEVEDKDFIAERMRFAKVQVNEFYSDLENFF